MNGVDSDLEEGEILDEIPSILDDGKSKKLPRRYILKENKDIHCKHKKECKHAIRHHAKKLSKLKKSPIKKDILFKPKKPCPHVKFRDKYRSKNGNHKVVPPKTVDVKSYSHSLTEGSVSFKDRDIVSLVTHTGRPETESTHSKSVVQKIESYSFSEMLAMYKTVKGQKSHNSVCNIDKKNTGEAHNSEGATEGDEFCEIIEVKKVKAEPTSPKSLEVINLASDDEEDEEELRRIALATCAKTDIAEKEAVHFIPNLSSNNSLVPDFLNAGPTCLPNITETPVLDNYEIVDMDVDDDSEKPPDNTDNLFVIDTKPSSDFQENSNSVSKGEECHNSDDDDDFEADILRAELIESMYRQKAASDKVVTDENSQFKLNGVSEPPLKADGEVFRDSPKPRIVRTVPETEVNNSPQRLIISLNAESSSDESDEDIPNPVNVLQENPVASIEALISDIRQKSDSKDKVNGSVESVVPKAVSCLSKAQQEEYNALMKILAKKKNLSTQAEQLDSKKEVPSVMDDLKLLEKKHLEVTEALKRKKELLTVSSKEVALKKQLYMKAKLTAQHLKEKYVAAEKVRRVKLDVWAKSCKNFEALKNSMSDLEIKKIELQELCLKVDSTSKGLNYSLPTVHSKS